MNQPNTKRYNFNFSNRIKLMLEELQNHYDTNATQVVYRAIEELYERLESKNKL